jgi:hypothetical protein
MEDDASDEKWQMKEMSRRVERRRQRKEKDVEETV